MYSDKLNKSHSESDLYITQFDNLSVSSPRDYNHKNLSNYRSTIRRIYIEEIVSFDNQSVDQYRNREYIFGDSKRSFSYNEIDDLSSPIYQREKIYKPFDIKTEPMDIDNSYTEERFPSMICPEMPRCKQTKTKNNKQDQSDTLNPYKPELSFVNTRDKGIDETDTTTEKGENLPQPSQKIRVIHITHKKKNHNLYKGCIIFAIISVVFYYLCPNTLFLNSDIQIEYIQKDLETNIIGHSQIVDNFVHLLKQRSIWSQKLKVISFVGSQGVGKTYFANLVQKNFHYSLAHEIHASHLDYKVKRQEIIDSIQSCCLNLIVIDDLQNTDSLELLEFVYSLPKDTFILLIAIYNTHYTDKSLNKVANYDDAIKIRNNFDNSGIKNFELFVFKDLTSDQIKDWVQKELTLKNISVPISKEILESVLEHHDVKSGLKGLQSKVLLELQKYIK